MKQTVVSLQTVGYSLAAMIRLYDNLADTEERLGRNANMKLTLTAMIAKL